MSLEDGQEAHTVQLQRFGSALLAIDDHQSRFHHAACRPHGIHRFDDRSTGRRHVIDHHCLCAGDPGPRQAAFTTYFGAFIFDPDGNKIEAVHFGSKFGETAGFAGFPKTG